MWGWFVARGCAARGGACILYRLVVVTVGQVAYCSQNRPPIPTNTPPPNQTKQPTNPQGARALRFVRKVPLLKGLSDNDLLRVAERMPERVYKDGQALIRYGERGDEMYLIRYGKVGGWMDRVDGLGDGWMGGWMEGVWMGGRVDVGGGGLGWLHWLVECCVGRLDT